MVHYDQEGRDMMHTRTAPMYNPGHPTSSHMTVSDAFTAGTVMPVGTLFSLAACSTAAVSSDSGAGGMQGAPGRWWT